MASRILRLLDERLADQADETCSACASCEDGVRIEERFDRDRP